MPTYIMKPDPEVDLYVGWSTVVDNLVWVATKEEILSDSWFGLSFELEPRLERADKTGTSAFNGEGAWGDKPLLVTNMQTKDGFGHLKRSDLLEYARILLDDGEYVAFGADAVAKAEGLITPIEGVSVTEVVPKENDRG